MAKIKLEAAPTFKAIIGIPIPGAKPAGVEFTFKHRTRDDVLKWIESLQDLSDSAVILSMASAWDLDDAFNAQNIELLCQNYAGAGNAIFEGYLLELRGARSKN